MKISVGQLNPHIGDFLGIESKIKTATQKAAESGSALIVFPELTLCGYPPQDLLLRPDFIQNCHQSIQNLLEWSPNVPQTAMAIGTPWQNTHALYNACIIILNGKIIQTYFKQNLPNYDIFDESRYFTAGTETKTFEIGNKKIGITICEDAWDQKYTKKPIQDLASESCDLIINLSASPYYLEKEKERFHLFSKHAQKTKPPILMVNQVGGNDDLIFDGQSTLYLPDGTIGYASPFGEEAIETLEWPKTGHAFKETNPLERLQTALCLGLKDYVQKCGFQTVVLGLSGGIDSALTAALAVKALGKDAVKGIALPSEYSSKDSIEDAQSLAQNLGIAFEIISINMLVNAFKTSLKPHYDSLSENATEENLQARIRGTVLMAIANRENRLLLTTGNKSELAVGYCTLYGDMNGGLSVIGDLYKTTVYKLAQFINTKKEIIPKSTLTKAPSAELKPNQKDQDTLPEYEILDAILKAHLEDVKSSEDIIALGHPKDITNWVLNAVHKNEHKRKQSAPILKISPLAFGKGRRLPNAYLTINKS